MIIRWILVGCIVIAASTAARAEVNTLSEREKQEGWILLFDGKSTRGWMSPNGKPLPQSHVQAGELESPSLRLYARLRKAAGELSSSPSTSKSAPGATAGSSSGRNH